MAGLLLSLILVLYFIDSDRKREAERQRGFPVLQKGKTETDARRIELLNAWEGETATADPEEIARRQEEFEEFRGS